MLLALCACTKTEPEQRPQEGESAPGPGQSENTLSPVDPQTPEEDEYAWVTEMFGPVPDAARTGELYEKLESGHVVVGFCAQNCADNTVLEMAESFMAYFAGRHQRRDFQCPGGYCSSAAAD